MIHGTCVENNLQESVLSTMWIFRIELKSSSLVARTVSHWAILLDSKLFLFLLIHFCNFRDWTKSLVHLDKGCNL